MNIALNKNRLLLLILTPLIASFIWVVFSPATALAAGELYKATKNTDGTISINASGGVYKSSWFSSNFALQPDGSFKSTKTSPFSPTSNDMVNTSITLVLDQTNSEVRISSTCTVGNVNCTGPSVEPDAVSSVDMNGITAGDITEAASAASSAANLEDGKCSDGSEKPADGECPEAATSCKIDGAGFIICPIVRVFASMIDGLFKILKIMFVVPALSTSTGTDNSIYNVWSYMRSFANMAFIIAFLVIIYSQVTSMGVSNYGIKKMIPRLIVAAILVNLSYWICAIAVDLSNVSGTAIYEFLVAARNETEANVTWEAATTALLSGGSIAVGAGLTIKAVAGSAAVASVGGGTTVLLWILIPILVGAAIAIVAAVATIAVRQGLIIMLIIVSPLAFVAYILPNTEKYFDKWKKLLMTMLVFYPIFALIFAGSQLAAYVLIGAAGDAGNDLLDVNSTLYSGVLLLLSMFVGIAPLFSLPFLMKQSGSILGSVNSKIKGIGDKLNSQYIKPLAKERENLARRASLNSDIPLKTPARGLRGLSTRLDNRLKTDARSKAFRKGKEKNIAEENDAVAARDLAREVEKDPWQQDSITRKMAAEKLTKGSQTRVETTALADSRVRSAATNDSDATLYNEEAKASLEESIQGHVAASETLRGVANRTDVNKMETENYKQEVKLAGKARDDFVNAKTEESSLKIHHGLEDSAIEAGFQEHVVNNETLTAATQATKAYESQKSNAVRYQGQQFAQRVQEEAQRVQVEGSTNSTSSPLLHIAQGNIAIEKVQQEGRIRAEASAVKTEDGAKEEDISAANILQAEWNSERTKGALMTGYSDSTYNDTTKQWTNGGRILIESEVVSATRKFADSATSDERRELYEKASEEDAPKKIKQKAHDVYFASKDNKVYGPQVGDSLLAEGIRPDVDVTPEGEVIVTKTGKEKLTDRLIERIGGEGIPPASLTDTKIVSHIADASPRIKKELKDEYVQRMIDSIESARSLPSTRADSTGKLLFELDRLEIALNGKLRHPPEEQTSGSSPKADDY